MEGSTIRRPAVAGSWYPGSEPAARQELESYLAQVQGPPLSGRLMGLIAPHAGWAYSGLTAAHAYSELRGRAYHTVAILAPSHRTWFHDPAVSAEDAYETPLGRIPVDHALAERLAARIPVQRIRRDSEHAVEIQLPFLQSVLGAFRLLPLLLSSDEPGLPLQLAQALSEAAEEPPWASGGLLLVASSDLHHVPDYDQVVQRDRRVVDAIAAFDLDQLTALLTQRDCSVCGRIPILAVLHACRRMGADAVHVLHHTNSGEITGRRQPGEYTVGYMSAAVLQRAPGLP